MSCVPLPSSGKDETLAKTYGLKPLTAMEVRKRPSTEAAKNLGSPRSHREAVVHFIDGKQSTWMMKTGTNRMVHLSTLFHPL